MGKAPAQIQHLDGKRMIAVSANVQGRSPGEVMQDAMKLAKEINFPPGYGVELDGARQGPEGSVRRDGHRAGHGHRPDVPDPGDAVRLVHAPLAVMLSLPLSLIGVVLALLLTKGT
jgi:HAE1 family hydrophobic/amphiphilic exporter-1